ARGQVDGQWRRENVGVRAVERRGKASAVDPLAVEVLPLPSGDAELLARHPAEIHDDLAAGELASDGDYINGALPFALPRVTVVSGRPVAHDDLVSTAEPKPASAHVVHGMLGCQDDFGAGRSQRGGLGGTRMADERLHVLPAE